MAISVVQAAHQNNFGAFAFGAPVTAGNTVFIVAAASTTTSQAMSSSSPTLGGSTPAGSVALFNPGGSCGVASGFNGGFGTYSAIWMLPNCPGGGTSIGLTITNAGTVTGAIAYEVSGLGASPSLDRSSSGTATGTTAVDSGSSGAITAPNEFVLATAAIFNQSAAGPGGWTSVNTFGGAGWAGYQVVTSALGTSYDWAQTGNSNGPWTAAVVTISPTPPPGALPAAVQPVPPGLASPAAFQFPQFRPLPPASAPVAASGSVANPPPPNALPAAPLLPPSPFTPMSAATRRPALPPVYPPVTITTTGATFSPVVALAGGSAATVTWSCTGFASQTGLTPSFTFGSAATRTVTMTVTGGGGYADVTLFNLGYDNTSDIGTYMPPSGFAKSAESVSAVSGISQMTGLVYFLADHTALACPLDFTGMSALQFIQCFQANVTAVTLTGCTALKRLMVEQCNLSYLDLNPVAGNLYDLRVSSQQGGTLTFAPLTSPMAVEYHYCVHSQILVNPLQAWQLPVVQQYWAWDNGLAGRMTFASSALNNVLAYCTTASTQENIYTSADLTGQFPAGRGAGLDMHGCQLTSITLDGCPGLTTTLDLSDNRLSQQAVDSILTTMASFGTSGTAIDLRYNSPPSAFGLAAASVLTGRGWTVSVDSPASVSVAQSIRSNFAFSGNVARGNTVIFVVCASGGSGTITSTPPLYNNVTTPGTVKLLEAQKFNAGSGNSAYITVWMAPHCGTAASGFTPPGIVGGNAQDQYAIDVAGLGVAPVLDVTVTGSGTGTGMDSGTTAPVRNGSEIVIGALMAFAGSAAGPSSPWTLVAGSGGHGWAGYQVASSPGGTYDWAQTASGSDAWVAGIVTVSLAGFQSAATPAAALLPPGLGSPGAWQYPQYRRLPPPVVINGSGAAAAQKASASGSAVARKQGGWWQLFEINRYREQEFQFYASNPPFSCPRCGEPLTNAPPTDSGSSVELFCRFDGWQFPGDWQHP